VEYDVFWAQTQEISWPCLNTTTIKIYRIIATATQFECFLL